MLKNLHIFMLSSLFQKYVRINPFWTGPHCLFLFGEPDIDIPEE